MQAEMAEQPAVLANLVTAFRTERRAMAALAPAAGAGIVLIARGSSDNAAIYGRYLLEWAVGRPVVLAAPSLLTRYRRIPDVRNWLTVAISQSGHTPEIVDSLRMLHDAGSHTIAITNEPDSPLAEHAERTIHLSAGRELAVPATKTVTTSFAALALLADALAGPLWSSAHWESLPAAIADLLTDEDGVDAAAELLAGAPGSIHLGRGFSYPAALESALKVKETSAIPAEGASTADFLHGPIAATAGRPAVCYALSGPAYDDIVAMVNRLCSDGSPAVVIGTAVDEANINVPAGGDIPEPLAVITLLARAQQLALAVARRMSVDPDRPGGLSKITRTS